MDRRTFSWIIDKLFFVKKMTTIIVKLLVFGEQY